MNKVIKVISFFENIKKIHIVLLFVNLLFFISALFFSFKFSIFPEYDELAYIDHVKTISESKNYFYLGDRNRMPLFNYFLFIFYAIEFPNFETYKLLQFANIFFTTLFSFWYCFKIKKFFKSNVAYLSCVIFTIFIPVFCFIHDIVVEPIFYLCFGLFFVYFLELINNFTYINSFKFGAIGVLLYLLKATGFFLLCLSLFFLIFYLIIQNRKITINDSLKIISSLVIFFVIASPYLYENYKNYNNNLFYNVNSTFYVWYDTWEEVENGTKLYGDRVGWPNMPDEDIPSLSKYLEEHTLGDVLLKIVNGYKNILLFYFSITEFTGSLTISIFLLLSYIFFKVDSSKRRDVFRKYKTAILYLLFLSAFILSSTAWYQLTNSIQRFSILIFVPMYLLIFLFFDKLLSFNNSIVQRNSFIFIVFTFAITQITIFLNYIV